VQWASIQASIGFAVINRLAGRLIGCFDGSIIRFTATVKEWTNGGSAYTRPGSPPLPSDTRLVTTYAEENAGCGTTRGRAWLLVFN
jgi:hypothetical protein